jgi:hypothetical protein
LEGSTEDGKSTTKYVFSLGTSLVSWLRKKQQAVSLSSTEVEYKAAVKGTCEAVWLRRMLVNMQVE